MPVLAVLQLVGRTSISLGLVVALPTTVVRAALSRAAPVVPLFSVQVLASILMSLLVPALPPPTRPLQVLALFAVQAVPLVKGLMVQGAQLAPPLEIEFVATVQRGNTQPVRH